MGGNDPVHEVEKLDPSSALVVARHHLAAGDVEGRKQRRGTMALVIMRPAAQGTPVRQLEITLGAFQCLNVRLLIDRDDQRALGRVEIKPDDLGRLRGKLGVLADAPCLAPGQVDLLRPQKAPDILLVHIAQRRGDQRRSSARSPSAADRRAPPISDSRSLSCSAAPPPACRSRRDQTGAARRNAPATCSPYQWCSRPTARSRASPCPRPPATQSAPAGAAGAPSSSSAPRRPTRPAPPRSKQSGSLPGCRSSTIESRLTLQR